jgi:hypothetical protein
MASPGAVISMTTLFSVAARDSHKHHHGRKADHGTAAERSKKAPVQERVKRLVGDRLEDQGGHRHVVGKRISGAASARGR